MTDSTAIVEAGPTRLNGEGTSLLGNLERCIERVASELAPKRDAIVAIVDERLAEVAPRRIEVCNRDGIKLGEVKGHVRPGFDKIANRVAAGVNVLLVGPAGCGKTTLAEQIADGLGLRFAFASMTSGRSESSLVGKFAPIGVNGQFIYVPASFVDFYENGGLFLADEVDAADANVLLAINTALANGQMETPNPAKPIIKRHPDFRMVAAANTWGHGATREYCGRNQLDIASLDRFCVGKFAIDYDEEYETKVGDEDLVAWAHELRRKVRRHKIRRVVSTRLIKDGTTVLQSGDTLDDVKASYLLDWSDDELALCNEVRPAQW